MHVENQSGKAKGNPRQLVYQHDKVKLYHYQSKHKKQSIPLLIVFATINRPDILDMYPEQSFIGYLLKNGIDVYLLDWGYPEFNDKDIAFEQYINKYLKNCVKVVCEQTRQEKINLLGICQGGVISLCYAAIHDNINKLVLISTPIDFHTKDNRVSSFLKKLTNDTFPHLQTNLPGLWLTQFFMSLKPLESISLKYAKFAQEMNDQKKVERFFQVEKWLYDAPDQPAQAFSDFIRYFYQENQLISGEVLIEGKRVNLKHLNLPVLNIIAKKDEIVPPSASKALKRYLSPAMYTQKYMEGGHIGIYISDQTVEKLPTTIARWIKKN